MSAKAALGDHVAAMTPRHALMRHIPVLLALLVIGGIYALISEQFALGPRGLIPGLIVALVVLLLAALRGGRLALGRTVGLMILAVVTVAEVIGTSALIASLLTAPQRMSDMPHALALALLRDAALVWIVNILTFSLWYWEIDAGGPGQRHHQGYHNPDFGFHKRHPGHLRACRGCRTTLTTCSWRSTPAQHSVRPIRWCFRCGPSY